MRRVLKALSFDGIEVEASRHLANLKAIDPMKIFHKTIDYKIYNGNHQIPVRIFLPGEKMEDDLPVFLFFHGGGWVTESIDNYERICARLASATDHIVVSVEYRLGPGYPFPLEIYRCHYIIYFFPWSLNIVLQILFIIEFKGLVSYHYFPVICHSQI